MYPVQAYANSHRNNLPFGEVGSGLETYTSANGTLKGAARSGLGYSGTVFEPIDDFKGDFARTYFYIATRYYNDDATWLDVEMADGSELKEWALNMLIDWHQLDSVSQKEIDRNDAAYTLQGNRNPFIDHPEYVDSIWASTSTNITAPSAQAATSIGTDRFTANWSSVATATGYKLYVSEYADFATYLSSYGPKDVANNLSETILSLSSSTNYYYRVRAYDTGTESSNSNIISVTTSSEASGGDGTIFFSEYIEGSSYNKALEIYNATGSTVDLADVTIKLYSNGNTSPSSTATLSGSLANAEVYVLAHGSSNAAILAEADITSGVVNFNGDDVVELLYQDTLIDIIGTVGSALNFGANVTLVRKPEIISGNTTYTASEWNSYSEDETSYLGAHTVSEVALAISLRYFEASYQSGKIILNWSTESETENVAFQIFRNNEFIASVEGAGTTSVTKYYEYIDRITKPGQTYTYLLNDIDYSGNINSHNTMSVTISTPSEGYQLLPDASIGAAYPNPFNPSTSLPISLKETAVVHIALHDVNGKKRREIMNKQFSPGEYILPIDVSNLPSAVYFLHVHIGNSMKTQKIVLSK